MILLTSAFLVAYEIARDRSSQLRRPGRNRRDVLRRIHSARVVFDNSVTEGVVSLAHLRKHYRNAARTDDSSLFACNFCHGVPEVLLVVESDIGNDADARIDDV